MKNKSIAPFLKWVGGKRQLIPAIKALIPNFTDYYEPFIGGGALLFHLQPKNALINDLNGELINVYRTIKESPEELIQDLETHENDPDYFYKIRAFDRQEGFGKLSAIQQASRVLYLNKTCYNGLYRVNNAGEFNVPFGKYKTPNIVNGATIRAVSKYLCENNITLLNQDFEQALKAVKEGAFVYFDPPYDPVSKSSNFTGYVQSGFNTADQERLKGLCDRLHEKGVKFLVSNAATGFVSQLYSEYNITPVKASRSINSDATKRGEVDEVLIRNYDRC